MPPSFGGILPFRTMASQLAPTLMRTLTSPRPLCPIEEEYDCGYLDLGAESPASESTPDLNREEISQWAAGAMNAPRSSLQRPSWRSTSKERGLTALKRQTSVDRDCGIWCVFCSSHVSVFIRFSFEYAVAPCRTLCCGKIFCTEHLAAVCLFHLFCSPL